MEHRNRRIFFLAIWGAIEWFFLYGAIFYGIAKGLIPLSWILGFSAIVLSILGVVWWLRDRGSSKNHRAKGSFTTRRVRLGLGLFLALEVAVLVFQLTGDVHLHQTTGLPLSAFSTGGHIVVPLGSMVFLIIGLLCTCCKDQGKSTNESPQVG
jgi:hypothetical protein